MNSLKLKTGLFELRVEFLGFVKKFLILLHEIVALFSEFFNFHILTVQSTFQTAFFLLKLSELAMVGLELVF